MSQAKRVTLLLRRFIITYFPYVPHLFLIKKSVVIFQLGTSDRIESVTEPSQWPSQVSDRIESVTDRVSDRTKLVTALSQWSHKVIDCTESVTALSHWQHQVSDLTESLTSPSQWHHRVSSSSTWNNSINIFPIEVKFHMVHL